MELKFPVILDGATGTELQKHGFDNKTGTEEWVLNHPDVIQSIQEGYVNAGSNVIYAPTFGANRVKLEANGISGQVKEFNEQLVALSKKASDGRALIAGNISPIGKFLPPMGDMSFDEMVDIYTEQAQALEETDVDLYVIETMMTVPEARAAMLAVKRVSNKPVFVTFTCDESGRTLGGTDVVAALWIMQGLGVAAFGLNCSTGPEEMIKQIRRMSEVAQIPLIAKPNAGLPETVDGKMVYNYSPEKLAGFVQEFAEAGVGVFGGCCGTEAGHIAAIREALANVELKLPGCDAGEGDSSLADGKKLWFAATETELIPIDPAAELPEMVPCDEDLLDAAEDAEDEETILFIRLEDASELDDLVENQYAFHTPVCFSCDDADLLEQALRLYQGRALYAGGAGGAVAADGDGAGIDDAAIRELVNRYGLILI